MRNALLPRVLLRIAIATWLSLMTAVLFISQAKADVVTCSDPTALGKFACPTQVNKPKSALVSTDLVLFCSSGITKPTDNCATSQWYRWSGMQPYSFTLTDSGWYRQDSIPTTTSTSFVYKPPTCFSFDAVHFQWVGSSVYAGIYCERPYGIIGTLRVYDLTKSAPKAPPATLTESQVLEFDKALTNRDLTPAEDKAVKAWAMSFKPTAKVANSTLSDGSIVGPPKYVKNPDGTRNTKSIGRAAKDQPCLIHDRIVSTSYYRLVDEDAYAQCVVTGKYVRLK